LAVANYGDAETHCLEAAGRDGHNVDAQECVLLAAIHLRHWSVAAEAAAALTRLRPADAWLTAVAAQVRLRHDPTLQIPLLMDRPVMAWACMDNPCSSQELPNDLEMRLLATLHAVHEGELDAALKLSADAPVGSLLAEVHLLILVRMQDFPNLREKLVRTPCNPPAESTVTSRLRLAFAADLPLVEGCEATREEAPGVVKSSSAANLNLALTAMRSGQYAAAATWLERCNSSTPVTDLPLVYGAINALLAQDDATARAHLLSLPPDLPQPWRDWLRKLPHRRLL